MKLTGTGVLAVAAVAGVALLAWWLYSNREKYNPRNPENVVNKAFTDTVRDLTGDKNWTLGGWIYEITHPFAYDPTRRTPRAAPASPSAFQRSLQDVWL